MFNFFYKVYKGLVNFLSHPFLALVGPFILILTFFAKSLLANFLFSVVFSLYFMLFLMFLFFEKAIPVLFLLQVREPLVYFFKKIEKDQKGKKTFATFMFNSLLKNAYKNPAIKKTVNKEVEQSWNKAIEVLHNMSKPLAGTLGLSILGGAGALEYYTQEARREEHHSIQSAADEKIKNLREEKRPYKADLLKSFKDWDNECFKRTRDQGSVSRIARDLFRIPLTEENTFTSFERKMWQEDQDELARKVIFETQEYDKAKQIEAKKLIKEEEKMARWAQYNSIDWNLHSYRKVWEFMKATYNQPAVQGGLDGLFKQLTSIFIAKSGGAALEKFEQVLSGGLDGQGAGTIGSALEERSGYVNQIYTHFLVTFTSFQNYVENQLEALRAKYGDALTEEIVSNHFLLNPFLESDQYEYLLFRLQQGYEEDYQDNPSSFESQESSSSAFSEFGYNDEGASTSNPEDPANRPLRRTDSLSDQDNLFFAEERKKNIFLLMENEELKQEGRIREATFEKSKKEAEEIIQRLRNESQKDTIKAHLPEDSDDSENDDNYNPFTDKGKGKKKFY